MDQKLIDNVKSFVSVARENGIKEPVIYNWGYKEKNDTIKLTFDYGDVDIHVEYVKDGNIGLIVYDNVNKSTIKNILVETKQELIVEMLKYIF